MYENIKWSMRPVGDIETILYRDCVHTLDSEGKACQADDKPLRVAYRMKDYSEFGHHRTCTVAYRGAQDTY